MARTATTADAFNAIAEARRRQILDLLATGERDVTELGAALELPQPAVSKHLRVLREVGLVRVREDGRRRLYRADPASLKPVSDWLRDYERLWSARLDRLADVLSELRETELTETEAGNDSTDE
ncbi:MAG: winged helix-turn-helix transcriptional regulator [Actinobacteria bacterium]|nr:winged helix-turn-helix transcriptional regulator [Actinomycetota bacterium]